MLMIAFLLAAGAAGDGKTMALDDWHMLSVTQVGGTAAGSPAYLRVAAGDLDGDGRADEAFLKLDCAGGVLKSAAIRTVNAPRDASSGMATGKRQHKPVTFVKEWGAQAYGFSFAHTVRVDKEDNVWVTDEGSNMVMKFNKQGIVTMVLGRKDEAIDYIERFLEEARHGDGQAPNNGAGRPNSFDRPTDVAWDTQGNGVHTVAVTADPANAITESNESNNTGTQVVTVHGGRVG